MIEDKILNELGKFWDIETGFCYKLRYRILDFEDGEIFLEYLRHLDFSENSYIRLLLQNKNGHGNHLNFLALGYTFMQGLFT